jgi:hypothetical protein
MRVDEETLLRNIKSLVDAEDDESFDEAFDNLEEVQTAGSGESLEGSK